MPLDVEKHPVYAEAAEWLMRLQEPAVTLEEILTWQQWTDANPLHACAFAELERLWIQSEGLSFPASNSIEDGYDASSTVSEWLARRKHDRLGRVKWAVAACLVLLIVVAQSLMRTPAAASVFETPVGGHESITLSDGTVMELGGDSRCEVVLDAESRRVALIRGEALFQVAKDLRRPFRVRSDSAQIEAVGTEFDVRRAAGRTVVAVMEGRVIVQALRVHAPVPWFSWTDADAEQIAVDAGSASYVDGTRVRRGEQAVSPETTLAWRQGRFAFEREPLRDVIASVNRYSAQRIEIDDPHTGDVLITGTVSASDINGWLASLDAALGIQVRHERDRIVLAAPVDPR